MKKPKFPLTKEVFQAICQKLTEVCLEQDIGGFFIAANRQTGEARFTMINRMSVLREGVEGKRNCNFAAVAGAKFGMVLAHEKDTGGEVVFFGEVPFKGGHIDSQKEFVYIFSGATQDEDHYLMEFADSYHMAISQDSAPTE